MQAGITDDTLHTPHIFPYIPGVLATSSQILSEDNVEECSPIVSLAEKSADEATSVIESEVCGSMKLSATETPELMKDDGATPGKNGALSPSIIVANAPKLLPTTPSPHL